MGMFAYVDFKAACPLCGLVLTSWQTKDPEILDFQRVSVDEVQNWYTDCYDIVHEEDDPDPPADAKWLWVDTRQERRFRRVGCGAWLEYHDGELFVTQDGVFILPNPNENQRDA